MIGPLLYLYEPRRLNVHTVKYKSRSTFTLIAFIMIIKVKLSLCLTKHNAIKAYWGMEVQLHAFFDLGTRRG
jgi:hypothetical protein